MWSPYPRNQEDFLGDRLTEIKEKFATYHRLIATDDIYSNEFVGRRRTGDTWSSRQLLEEKNTFFNTIFSHDPLVHNIPTGKHTEHQCDNFIPDCRYLPGFHDLYVDSATDAEAKLNSIQKSDLISMIYLQLNKTASNDNFSLNYSYADTDQSNNMFSTSQSDSATAIPRTEFRNKGATEVEEKMAEAKTTLQPCHKSFSEGFMKTNTSLSENTSLVHAFQAEDLSQSFSTLETFTFSDTYSRTVIKEAEVDMMKAHNGPQNISLATPKNSNEKSIIDVILAPNQMEEEILFNTTTKMIVSLTPQCRIFFHMLQKSVEVSTNLSQLEDMVAVARQKVYDPGGGVTVLSTTRVCITTQEDSMGHFSLKHDFIVHGTCDTSMLRFMFIIHYMKLAKAPLDKFIVLVFDPGGHGTRPERNKFDLEDKVDLKRGGMIAYGNKVYGQDMQDA